MKKTETSLKTILLAVLALSLSVAVFAHSRPQFDPLGRLNHALQSATAPALSAAQEDQLKALIQQAREAHKSITADPAVKAARDAFDAAILAGDQGAANAQAGILANLMATANSNRMKDQANYTIQALNVLKTNQAQIDALTQKFEAAGVVHLLGSLFGGPGRPGGPGGPRGPGGPGERPDGPPPGGRFGAPGRPF